MPWPTPSKLFAHNSCESCHQIRCYVTPEVKISLYNLSSHLPAIWAQKTYICLNTIAVFLSQWPLKRRLREKMMSLHTRPISSGSRTERRENRYVLNLCLASDIKASVHYLREHCVVGVVFMNKCRQHQCQGYPQLILKHILKQHAIQLCILKFLQD